MIRIKKYNQFIKESHSFGEWVESVSEDNDDLLNIISQYTQDVDPTVRLANAINILSESQQKELRKRIQDHLSGVEQPQDVDVSVNVDATQIVESVQLSGKNIFKSFLKAITAMGLKEHAIDWSKVPDNFLIYFSFENVDVSKLKLILGRFKSLSMYINSIDYTFNLCSIYFGIKTDMTFEYGFKTGEMTPIGKFSMNKSNLNWLLLLDSPSAAPLKRQLIDLDINKILLFSKIKTEMSKWNPGYAEKKSAPQISNDVITFGYYGVGKWSNGKLDESDFETIKNNFKTWLSKFKWSERILVSVTSSSFWVYFNFKLK